MCADFFCDENVFDSAVAAARDQDRDKQAAHACEGAPPTAAGGDASACSSPLNFSSARQQQQQQRLRSLDASCSSSSSGSAQQLEGSVAELLTMIR